MNTLAIATHLNVLETAIVRIEEWSNVLFVVAKGLGARFVSKKINVGKMELFAGANLRIGKTSLAEFAAIKSENILLSELSGSEKQVKWANEIRDNWMSEFDRFIAEATSNIERLVLKNRGAQARFEEYVETANKFIIGCSEMTSASNWINQVPKTCYTNVIDHRFDDVLDLYLRSGGEIDSNAKWSDFYQI
jgi:hypothetical protein